MIPVMLEMKGKHILIIGGGKQGLRKTKQFIEEGALVTVVSLDFLDEFDEYDIDRVYGVYDPKYLKDQDLVYACSNDMELNHLILLDCKKENILSGSIHYDEDSDFHSMAYREHELGIVSYYSNARMPHNTVLLDKLLKTMDIFKYRMNLMMDLRPYVIVSDKNTGDYFDLCYHCDISILEFLVKCIREPGVIFIYPHGKDELKFVTKPHLSLTISMFQEYQQLFTIDLPFIICPMSVSYGRYYERMTSLVPENHQVLTPLCSNDEEVELVTALDSDREIFYVTHSRKENYFTKYIREHKGIIYYLNDELPLEKDKRYEVLLLLLGHEKHYRDYQEKVRNYKEQGYDIVCKGTLLDHPHVMRYFRKRIGDQ